MRTVEDVEREIFFLEMKDTWDSVDWHYYRALLKELNECENTNKQKKADDIA